MKFDARTGSLLFALSGVVFVIMGIRDRDTLTLVATVPWLLGCWAMFRSSDGD